MITIEIIITTTQIALNVCQVSFYVLYIYNPYDNPTYYYACFSDEVTTTLKRNPCRSRSPSSLETWLGFGSRCADSKTPVVL